MGTKLQRRTVLDINPPAHDRSLQPLRHPNVVYALVIWPRHKRHADRMLHRLLPARSFSHETHRRREYDIPPLAGLDRPRRKRLSRPDVFDMVNDRDAGNTSQHKVAVHAVDVEVVRHGLVRGGQTLRNDCTAVDAACAWRMPQRAGVGVEILAEG